MLLWDSGSGVVILEKNLRGCEAFSPVSVFHRWTKEKNQALARQRASPWQLFALLRNPLALLHNPLALLLNPLVLLHNPLVLLHNPLALLQFSFGYNSAKKNPRTSPLNFLVPHAHSPLIKIGILTKKACFKNDIKNVKCGQFQNFTHILTLNLTAASKTGWKLGYFYHIY